MIPAADRRKALLARLKELDGRLHAIEHELEETPSKDWEEAAVEREGDEVLEQLGQAGQEEIRRIQAALHRIRAGDYGACVRCGETIPEARLNILPATPFCPLCAAAAG